MEENLDNPQQDRQPSAEFGPAGPRYKGGAQPANNSSSQYSWLQMCGWGCVMQSWQKWICLKVC